MNYIHACQKCHIRCPTFDKRHLSEMSNANNNGEIKNSCTLAAKNIYKPLKINVL